MLSLRNSQYAFLWYLGIEILLASMKWKYMCTCKFNAHIFQRWKKFLFSCYDITSLPLSWTWLNNDFKFYDLLSMSTSVVVPNLYVCITIHKLHTDILCKRPYALLTQSLTPLTLALLQHRFQASNNGGGQTVRWNTLLKVWYIFSFFISQAFDDTVFHP